MVKIISYFFITAVLALGQQAALPPVIHQPWLDNNGKPLAGGKLYFYAAGTNTPLATYTDSTANVQNAQPVTLDSTGWASIWLGASAYKVVAQTSTGVSLWTMDNVQNNGLVLSSSAVLLNPPGNVSQTVAGPLSLAGYGLTSNSVTTCQVAGLYIVGSSCYANIAAALTAAGTSGTVLIPHSYAGTDAYVAGNKNVLDLRNNFLGPYQYIAPSRPITGYPLGSDLALDADGPADLYLVHDDLANAKQLTTTTVAAGTQNIAVSDSSKFTTNAGAVLGRETANEEICPINSIPDSTHLNVTCAKSHSGTTDVEQLGNTVLKGGYGLALQPSQPSQVSSHSAVFRIGTAYNTLWHWPINQGDAFPYSAIQVSAAITGMSGGQEPTNAGDLRLRNASASNCIDTQSSTGTNLVQFCDAAVYANSDIVNLAGGVNKLGDPAHPWASVYVGPTGGAASSRLFSNATAARTVELPDGNAHAVISATITTTSATSDSFTIQGLTASSLCVLGSANLAAANNLNGSFIPSTASNALTLTHSAVAGMVYRVYCTSN